MLVLVDPQISPRSLWKEVHYRKSYFIANEIHCWKLCLSRNGSNKDSVVVFIMSSMSQLMPSQQVLTHYTTYISICDKGRVGP